mgnify:CR=1 FL=1
MTKLEGSASSLLTPLKVLKGIYKKTQFIYKNKIRKSTGYAALSEVTVQLLQKIIIEPPPPSLPPKMFFPLLFLVNLGWSFILTL